MITYANLGKYYCPNCGFTRPQLDYKLTDLRNMTNTSAEFTIDNNDYKLEVGGMYNIYNALAATAVAEYYHVAPEKIRKGIGFDEKVFGRQEVVDIDGKKCTLVLVKNPVGLNQVIDMIGLSPYNFSLVSLLNANYADGTDISWIWDGNYEAFSNTDIPKVISGGERHEDMTKRLKVAGISEDKIMETQNLDEVIEQIKQLPTEQVYILSTYTAVLQLRKKLADMGYIKGGMDRG